ncbi:hypothetical protein A6C39_17010 [Salmonella enterica]|nr:hypothetical protein VI31_13320 [Salmonella enterica subsp. enterica serovar Mishmarhaemek]KTX73556.1 hypothetical protein DD63_01700 [Salmonella enterica subsp. enterica serovar 4,12:d:-]OAG47482.1 hypothetical protein A6C38_23000 [Salmonella enterica]OAG52773.1 hypothetical protein A6C39_17010 [Salmonella enterica]
MVYHLIMQDSLIFHVIQLKILALNWVRQGMWILAGLIVLWDMVPEILVLKDILGITIRILDICN